MSAPWPWPDATKDHEKADLEIVRLTLKELGKPESLIGGMRPAGDNAQ